MCTCADGWSCTQGGGNPPYVQEGGAAHRGGDPCTKRGEPLHKSKGNPPGEVGLHKSIAQLGVTPSSCALLSAGGMTGQYSGHFSTPRSLQKLRIAPKCRLVDALSRGSGRRAQLHKHYVFLLLVKVQYCSTIRGDPHNGVSADFPSQPRQFSRKTVAAWPRGTAP